MLTVVPFLMAMCQKYNRGPLIRTGFLQPKDRGLALLLLVTNPRLSPSQKSGLSAYNYLSLLVGLMFFSSYASSSFTSREVNHE